MPFPIIAGGNSNLIGDSSHAGSLEKRFQFKSNACCSQRFLRDTAKGHCRSSGETEQKPREFRIIHAIEDPAEFSMRKIPKARTEGGRQLASRL
jgi:hypothetical protein